jgi:hypothetical protein
MLDQKQNLNFSGRESRPHFYLISAAGLCAGTLLFIDGLAA